MKRRWWRMGWVVGLGLWSVLVAGCGGCGIEESPGTLKVGDADRQGLMPLEEEGRDRVRQGSLALSFEIFDGVRQESDADVVMSPQAVLMGISQLIPATEGQSSAAVAELWGVEEDELEMVMAVLNQQGVHLERQSGADLRFDHRNDLWVDEKSEPDEGYLELLRRYTGRGVHVVDEESDINHWVGRVMGDGELEVIGDWEEGTAALTQAVHISGVWRYGFESTGSSGGPMESADAEHRWPMMEGRESYRFYRDSTTQAVAFGYQGANTSLVAMKPRSATMSIEEWGEGFDGERFQSIVEGLSRLEDGEVDLPEFDLRQQHQLGGVMEELAVEVFGDEADLSGFGERSPERVATVGHVASLEVGERGGRQSAEHVEEAGRRGEAIAFDRPFYFAVYDEGAEAILLLGRLKTGFEYPE